MRDKRGVALNGCDAQGRGGTLDQADAARVRRRDQDIVTALRVTHEHLALPAQEGDGGVGRKPGGGIDDVGGHRGDSVCGCRPNTA